MTDTTPRPARSSSVLTPGRGSAILTCVRSDLPTGTVTFLFTDIEESTRLLETLGPAGYGEALAEHRRILRAACGACGGVEVDTQGDAFFVAFPTAEGAVRAVSEAFAELEPGPIRVRAGLHTGTPHLVDEGYVGRDVHLGARIAAAAHGGQALLSRETRELLSTEVLDLGEHRLKDFAAPVWIFQLGTRRFPPLKTISNTNLPHPVSSFVGRSHEVAEVASLLRKDARLVTLTGPGGSGKTRLAIEAASELVPELRNGVFWIGLASVRDPALVDETISQVVGARDSLPDWVGERELLLLLDNFEQVIDAAPRLSSLLRAGPGLRLLVTSRERLRIQGEREYAVEPLAEPEGVELFCSRAQLEPDEQVRELCRRLENLPLALELAAARTSVLTVPQLLDRLGQRLDLLKGGRDAVARQQTLRATIEWSYDLLDPAEQRLFASLAILPGGCTLEAAEQVCDAELDVLQSLVDKSLVRRTDDRFWMLETIRELAAERLARSGQQEDLERRRLNHYLAFTPYARRTPARQLDWLLALMPERTNLRVVLEHALRQGYAVDALNLAASLQAVWENANMFREALTWYLRGLELPGDVPPGLRGSALCCAGICADNIGDNERAIALTEEAVQVLRDAGFERLLSLALMNLASPCCKRGEFARARDALGEALERSLRRGDEMEYVQALHYLGEVELQAGNPAEAEASLSESLERAREQGAVLSQCYILHGLAEAALLQGDEDTAAAHYRASLAIALETGSEPVAVACVTGLALVAARRGDLATGRSLAQSIAQAEASDPTAFGGRYERHEAELERLRTEAGDGLLPEWEDAVALALTVA